VNTKAYICTYSPCVEGDGHHYTFVIVQYPIWKLGIRRCSCHVSLFFQQCIYVWECAKYM